MESLHDHRRKLKTKIGAQLKELSFDRDDIGSYDFFSNEPDFLYRNDRRDI